MFQSGQRVGVICDRYGRPSRDAYQSLQGEVVGVIDSCGKPRYSVRVDQPDRSWVVTAVEDDTLLFSIHH